MQSLDNFFSFTSNLLCAAQVSCLLLGADCWMSTDFAVFAENFQQNKTWETYHAFLFVDQEHQRQQAMKPQFTFCCCLARHILSRPYFTVKSCALLVILYVYCTLLTVVTCAMWRLLWPLIPLGYAGWLERCCDVNKIGFWDTCTPF